MVNGTALQHLREALMMMSMTMPHVSHTLTTKKRVPVILQSEAAECGLACMAMIAQYY